jgi:hypothetical protein
MDLVNLGHVLEEHTYYVDDVCHFRENNYRSLLLLNLVQYYVYIWRLTCSTSQNFSSQKPCAYYIRHGDAEIMR